MTCRLPVPGGLALAVLAYLLAFVLLSGGGAIRSTALVLAAVVLFVVAAALLQLALGRVRRDGSSAPRWRLRVPLAITAAGVVIFITWLTVHATGGTIGGWGLGGLCAAYLGLGQVLAELRTRPEWCRRGRQILLGCVFVFLAGIALCLAVWARGLAFSAVALLVAPIGLTLLSEDVLRRPPVGVTRRVWLPGSLIVLGSLSLWVLTQPPLALLLVLVAVAAALVGMIASSTQADVLVVVTVITLVWAESPAGVPLDDDVRPTNGRSTLVALGDSYISGEGADAFFEGTNDDGVNECRRAPTAYAHVVVAERRLSDVEALAFHACSGALAQHLHTMGAEGADDPPGEGEPQLRRLAVLPRAAVRLVLVSIGGNDAGFSDIGRACLAPGSCGSLAQLWLDRLERDVRPKVAAAYGAIVDAVDRSVPVVAVPYPVPLRSRVCSSSLLRDDEHRFLVGFVGELNRLVGLEARRAGFAYVDAMPSVFERRRLRICDGPRDAIGMNHVRLRSVEGVVDQVMHPGNWVHNSLHPNERGHRAMADELEHWLELGSARRREPLPDLPDYTAPPLERILPDAPEQRCARDPAGSGCERDWLLEQLGRLTASAMVPVALIAAGWWLLWLPVLRTTRRRSRRMGDRLARRLFRSIP